VIGSIGWVAGTSYERRKACYPTRWLCPSRPSKPTRGPAVPDWFLRIGVRSSAKTVIFDVDSAFRSGAPEEIRTLTPHTNGRTRSLSDSRNVSAMT
jgi:hypothetical protein